MKRRRPLEKDIEAFVVKWAKSAHLIDSVKLNALGHRGWPDRLFWMPNGKPLLIEFKRPGEHPTELQAYYIRTLREKGYAVYVCDSIPEAQECIRHHMATSPLSTEGAGLLVDSRRGGPVPRSGLGKDLHRL